MTFLCGKEINIRLKPGIYLCEAESATGKTYLYKMLLGLHSHPEVICITYDTVELIADFETLLISRKAKLVILDRYDMYAGRFDDTIEKYRDDIIFIIDYKQGCSLNRYAKSCYVELSKDKLEVIDCDDF